MACGDFFSFHYLTDMGSVIRSPTYTAITTQKAHTIVIANSTLRLPVIGYSVTGSCFFYHMSLFCLVCCLMEEEKAK